MTTSIRPSRCCRRAAPVTSLAGPISFTALLLASLLSRSLPASADDRIQARLLDPDPVPQHAGHRVHYVQLGTYPTLREASYLRSVVQNLGPTRVEQKDGAYRVLLGRFGDPGQAEAFVKEHRLRKLFPGLWVDVLSSDISGGPGNGAVEIPLTEQEKDLRFLQIDLHCGKDAEGIERKTGRYTAQFVPEPGQTGPAPSMEIHWSCATASAAPAQPQPVPVDDKAAEWAAKDRERNPSFVGIAPMAAMGSFSATGGTLGALSLTHFSYGFQLSAFKSFGGIGPIAEYRLINARYGGGTGVATPFFSLQHDARVGVRLPFAHRFEIEPMGGFASQAFLLGTSLSDASFKSIWTPLVAGRVRLRLFELSNRASIDLTGGYAYFLPGTNADVAATSGSVIMGQLRARHFTTDSWGADWFFEFNSISRGATGLTQGENLFKVGVSFLITAD
jgi:hypothetical protein